jgi:osmoprotectant transport system ATP-binding protein
MIKLMHVSKSFDGGQTYAVKDLSFQVRKGETLVLLGSSGCGKTTTLKGFKQSIIRLCSTYNIVRENQEN